MSSKKNKSLLFKKEGFQVQQHACPLLLCPTVTSSSPLQILPSSQEGSKKSQGGRLKRLFLPKRSCKTLIGYKAVLTWYFPTERNTKTKQRNSPLRNHESPKEADQKRLKTAGAELSREILRDSLKYCRGEANSY